MTVFGPTDNEPMILRQEHGDAILYDNLCQYRYVVDRRNGRKGNDDTVYAAIAAYLILSYLIQI